MTQVTDLFRSSNESLFNFHAACWPTWNTQSFVRKRYFTGYRASSPMGHQLWLFVSLACGQQTHCEGRVFALYHPLHAQPQVYISSQGTETCYRGDYCSSLSHNDFQKFYSLSVLLLRLLSCGKKN